MSAAAWSAASGEAGFTFRGTGAEVAGYAVHRPLDLALGILAADGEEQGSTPPKAEPRLPSRLLPPSD